MPSGSFDSDCTGVFDSARSSLGTCSVSCHGTLKLGSSKQGNARRASVGSNWLYTYHLAVFLQLENTRAAVAADLALIDDVQNALAGNRAIERESEELIAARHGLGRQRVPGFRTKRGFLNLQADRVQPNHFGGRANIDS